MSNISVSFFRSISSQSNLRSAKELSGSKSTLFTNFSNKFRTMRKAMSMDRGLDEVHEEEKKKTEKKEKGEKEKKDKKKKKEEKLNKAPSLKSLTSIFRRKSRDKQSTADADGEVTENQQEQTEK